jgi:hypothetical protein
MKRQPSVPVNLGSQVACAVCGLDVLEATGGRYNAALAALGYEVPAGGCPAHDACLTAAEGNSDPLDTQRYCEALRAFDEYDVEISEPVEARIIETQPGRDLVLQFCGFSLTLGTDGRYFITDTSGG